MPYVPVVQNINEAQSTHTSSVHRSVSDSARRLSDRYGEQLKGLHLDMTVDSITTYLSALPAGLINDAAKRCLVRLIEVQYVYTDTVSNVSTRQLLALSWLAIHDEELRIGSLEDALKQFVEGLYECQRGYNLSDTGIDHLALSDSHICVAGTFNKLVEKLAGIHPDVVIIFITSKLAGIKLPRLVKEEAERYLMETTNPKTASDFVSITSQLVLLEKEGISAIWTFIKDKVSARLFEEFGSLYTNEKDQRFIDLIDSGLYTDLGKLRSYQKELSASEGYGQYCKAMIAAHQRALNTSTPRFFNMSLIKTNDGAPQLSKSQIGYLKPD